MTSPLDSILSVTSDFERVETNKNCAQRNGSSSRRSCSRWLLFESWLALATALRTVVESMQRKVVVGLAHNDLHGGNLLVDSQGLVWLIDFATVKQDQHVLIDAWIDKQHVVS